MALYGSVEYWNKRYNDTEKIIDSVEWYRSYKNLRHLINPISFSTSTGDNNNIVSASDPAKTDPTLTKTTKNEQKQSGEVTAVNNNQLLTSLQFPSREECKVLIIGCGCSSFGADMIRDGWTGRIVNVDFSPIVIEQMKNKYNDEFYDELAKKKVNATKVNKMEFICADLTNEYEMTKLFKDSSFDLIICKATLDAILNTPTPMINAQKLIKQCQRMLADQHGIFFVVTNGNADNRLEIFEYDNNLHYLWQNVGIHSLNNPGRNKHHNQNHRSSSSTVNSSNNERNVYVYICRKRNVPLLDKENSINMQS